MSRTRMSCALAISLALLAVAARADRRQGAPPGPGGAPAEFPPNEIKGGEVEIDVLSLVPDQNNENAYFVRGVNKTGKRIKDFELELKGCKPPTGFDLIKVFTFAKFDADNIWDPRDLNQTFDWDVDDDLSGLSDQDFVNDPGAPGGKSNETDNYDDSPAQKARVDANGRGYDEENHSRSNGEPLSAAEEAAIKDDGEDKKERRPGDPLARGKEPLDGEGGVPPDANFLLAFHLTGPLRGDGCKLGLTPSGVGAKKIELAALPGGAYQGLEFAFTPGGTFGSIGTRLKTSFGGSESGDAIHYDAANLHGDVRYYAGDLGRVGSFRPELFAGLKGAVTLGSAEKGLREDVHPPGGDLDSFVNYEIDGSLTPYLGLVLADWDCSRLSLLTGPRITFDEITGETDESGGGGQRERFRNRVVQVGPAVGVELDVPVPRARWGGLEGGVRFAGWGEYLPGTHVTGNSSTFPFDYRFETKGAFLFTVRAGLVLRLGRTDAHSAAGDSQRYAGR